MNKVQSVSEIVFYPCWKFK